MLASQLMQVQWEPEFMESVVYYTDSDLFGRTNDEKCSLHSRLFNNVWSLEESFSHADRSETFDDKFLLLQDYESSRNAYVAIIKRWSDKPRISYSAVEFESFDISTDMFKVSVKSEYRREEHSCWKDITALNLELVYEHAKTDEQSAASVLMDSIEKNISESKFDEVDQILRRIDFNKAGIISAISAIKSTKRCNNRLRFWNLARFNAEKTLKESGYDTLRIFKGI